MNHASRDFLLTHSAHDYATVLLRWRAVAAKAGLKVTTFASIGDHEIIAIQSEHRPTAEKGIYLSAGIHGDEPAGVWGLLAWAEAHIDCLAHRPCLIFPCFNPWGLLHNNRLNEQGEDLNRRFHDAENLLVTAWLQFVGRARFQIALCLHEDYDSRGIYLYELGRRGHEMGEPCLQACEAIIPRDPNSEIEGRRARAALIQRKSGVAQIAKQLDGLPEAIHLYIHHARFCLTFETPSEYSFYERVQTQVCFIETALRQAGVWEE